MRVKTEQRLGFADLEVDLADTELSSLESMIDWGCMAELLAGVRGDQSARIFCQKLDAELVSIAGIYRVAEDLPEQHRKQAVHITLDGDAMRFADLK